MVNHLEASPVSEGMPRMLKRLAKPILAGLLLLPVLWALVEEPGSNELEEELKPKPADSSRIRRRKQEPPKPSATEPAKPVDVEEEDLAAVKPPLRTPRVIHVLRSEPLDASARSEGERALRRMQEAWREDIKNGAYW
jgi:hypothetical protein